MATITAVVFKEGGKTYYFAPRENEEYKVGSGVVVETSRGIEYATVVTPRAEVDDEKLVLPLKPIVRAATAKDEETHRKNTERRADAMKTVKEKIEKHNLEMKLIDCEFAFDGSKAVFYYSAPQRVDFRDLVKELSSCFHMRIELRQVGIRDEIKLIGGISPCGRECCCSSCMPDVKKVSIKMAKTQGLSLNPQKISGLCGRLMCCLSYENDYYAETCKQMPKIGTELNTPDGKGVVVNVNMLKMLVRVRIEDKAKDSVTYKDYSVDDLKYGHAERRGADLEPESDNGVKEVIAEKVKEDAPAQNGGENRQNRNRKRKKKNKNGNKPNGAPPAGQGNAQGNKQGEKPNQPENNGQNGGKKKKNKFRNFQNKNA
ncbi:MAG: stage 0 sporulation family protein [Clostridia bacterium]|nr:stage 0 sporulation family protein [Clostridia bacterium]